MTISEAEVTALFPSAPVQTHREIASHLYRAPDGSIAALASRKHMLPFELSTRISKSAAEVLEALKELRAAGVLVTAYTQLHTRGIEVIDG